MHWHLVTGEFPPQPGGVSDYTLSVARGLASAGESVHVWCPTSSGPVPQVPVYVVHATAGTWSREDIARVDRELDADASAATPARAVGAARVRAAIDERRLLPLGAPARPQGRRRGADGARGRAGIPRGIVEAGRRGHGAPLHGVAAAQRVPPCVGVDPRMGGSHAALRVRPSDRVLLAAGAEQRARRRRPGGRARGAGALCSAATARWSVTSARTRSARDESWSRSSSASRS